jgi:alanyl aminopeptidase
MPKPRRSAVTALVVLALAALPATVRSAPAAEARLGHAVAPTFEAVRLKLDAGQTDYSGSVRVDLRASEPASTFRFHAEGQKLTRLALFQGDREVPVQHQAGDRGVVSVQAAEPLVPGKPYRLEVDFTQPFNTQAVSLYRVQQGSDSYVFSQFEADEARQAFPCWDEPVFKIPYQITIEAPAAHQVVTNTPVESESERDGWRTTVFKKTPPLPSYLLAIATGQFEFTPIQGLGVPGRIVTVRGQSRLAGAAAEMTPRLLAPLEKYFGRPYPYEKLDLIAVPEFWPGAMENPGAITFADNILLVDPATETSLERRYLALVTAHELAHMWFGDLVTLAWWDDLWLNESFADWMGDKVTDQVYPELRHGQQELMDIQSIMALDARPSTRPIRQPVESAENVLQGVDLAYDKGKAVLEMFEAWLGPETFRKGVNAYLKEHEHGSATSADLWRALSTASGQDVGSSMGTFLDQSGLPLVRVEALSGNRLRLTQQRFLGAGVKGDARTWQIPVRIDASDGRTVRSTAVLLKEPAQTVTVDGLSSIAWVLPNAEAQGYYRWSIPEPMLLEMASRATSELDTRERIGFVGNLAALLEAGEVRGDTYLKVLKEFSADPEPQVITSLMRALEKVRGVFWTPELDPAFALYTRQLFGPARDRFGLEGRPGEEEAVSILRPLLLYWLGSPGQDESIQRQAGVLTRRVLAGEAVEPAMIDVSLNLTAIQGDRALFDEYRKRFEGAQTPADRSRYLEALGRFRDAAIQEEALRYALAGPLRPNEVLVLANGVRQAKGTESSDRVMTWMETSYPQIVAKVPPVSLPFLPMIANGCSEERLERARKFFSQPEHQVPGTLEQLGRIADSVQECLRLQQREKKAVTEYLQSLAKGAGTGS